MDDNKEVDSSESVENQPSVDYAAKKRRILMLLLAYSAIVGVVSCFLPLEDRALAFIVGLPLLILGISWCLTDAAERDDRIGRLMTIILVLIFIVGLPIYLLQTRGIGAFKSLGWTLLIVAAMFACSFATEFATLYVGEVAGLWGPEY